MKRKNKDQMVTLWDASSNTFTQIPKCELAPGMVQCKIQGRKGLVWREAVSINLNNTPYRHPKFEGEICKLIGSLSMSFAEVYEHSYDFWEDGFRKDTNPLKEIHIWMVVAQVYHNFAEGRSLAYRKELFQLVLRCTLSSKVNLPIVFDRNLLSAGEVEAIANAYYGYFPENSV